MKNEAPKMIVAPVDGSGECLKSLDYVSVLFRAADNVRVALFHVLPALPPFLVEECKKDRTAAQRLREVETKNVRMAETLLQNAKKVLLDKGFADENIQTIFRKKVDGPARDICNWSNNRQADAIVIATRGRSRLEAFFTGETANKVLEFSQVCPVWMIKGTVKSRPVVVAVDTSENSMKAVDHVGFMLSGTDCPVIVFHSKRDLRRFVPKEIFEDAPELEKLWRSKAGEQIAPFIQRARDMLIKAGVDENRISVRIVDGSRNPAGDILEEAVRNGAGTVVLGRRGYSGIKSYTMGSVSRKVLEAASDKAVWIVP